jgi:hypothetical protein
MSHRSRHMRCAAGLVSTTALLVAAALGGTATATPSTPRVLRVGAWHGIRGSYTTIQAAVDAAKPGDWVLVGPGDYKEAGDYSLYKPTPTGEAKAGVWIDTPNMHLRGMNRRTVVVDGTKPGSAPCSNKPADQVFGPLDASKKPMGRNGVEIWQANNVSVENLTVCNYLSGSSNGGNELWWNGGDGTAKVGGHGYFGDYLTATSTYFGAESTAAAYGIFSSNWSGGTWDHSYASNFNDSGYYIGACQQVCDQVMTHAWAQYSALGYSGSNSGGSLIIENSEFDHNEDGFDTNSQNGDNPPPQNGACPGNGISPITHTHSCWVFMHNYVHDNNDPNVPAAGSAAAGPVGTGMSISGGRNDTVVDNRFVNNNAWGLIVVPYPDNGPPCTGGTLTPAACLYDTSGVAVINNTYANNGSFGNPTNGDIAEARLEAGPSNCYSGNTNAGGPATTSPTGLQTLEPTCGGTVPPDTNPPFLAEVACDSQASIGPVGGNSACLPTDSYPRRTRVVMHALPASLTTMPNPCAGVPANPWCPQGPGPAPVASRHPFASSARLAATGEPAVVPLAGLLVVLLAATSWRTRRRFITAQAGRSHLAD